MAEKVNELIDSAVEAVQAAHRRQHYGVDPDHTQFYAWGWGLSALAAELASLVVLLENQVYRYPDRWQLRDDAGHDPGARIDQCARLLAEIASALGTAGHLAQLYHSEMGHIAVDDDRWEVD